LTPLVVGVTGHRVLAEIERIRAAIDAALDAFERRFPGRPLVALSALAEGADRLVAERVLARFGGALRVVLPLPRADYASDFAAAGSRRELEALCARAEQIVELPARGAREEAYEAAGHYVVERSDVLVAVWDGQEARGRGGTAAMVERARLRGLPIAWIRAGNRPPEAAAAVSLDTEQGRLIMENL
jgi:hypothetical protein